MHTAQKKPETVRTRRPGSPAASLAREEKGGPSRGAAPGPERMPCEARTVRTRRAHSPARTHAHVLTDKHTHVWTHTLTHRHTHTCSHPHADPAPRPPQPPHCDSRASAALWWPVWSPLPPSGGLSGPCKHRSPRRLAAAPRAGPQAGSELGPWALPISGAPRTLGGQVKAGHLISAGKRLGSPRGPAGTLMNARPANNSHTP